MTGRILQFGGAALLLASFFVLTSVAPAGGAAGKVIAAVTLVPAAALAAWAASGLIRRDIASVLGAKVLSLRPAAFLALPCLFVALFCSWVALGPLDGIPKGGDETAYLLQARIFARGELSAPQPSVPDPRRFLPFRLLLFEDGRMFTMYTPLHSLMLAPFAAAGADSLLGPLEGVLSLVGAYLLLRLLGGELKARLSVLLMAASPFFLLMSATRMAHNTSLMLCVWGLYLIASALKGRSAVFAAAGGLLLGLMVNCKPYPDIGWWLAAVAVILALGGRRRWALLGATAAGALPAAALFLLSNLVYTGNPFSPAYNLARGGSLVGFGPDKAWFPVYGDHAHTPLRGLMNVCTQAAVASIILLGWPLASLLPAIFALADRRRRRLMAALWAPVLLFALLVSLHYSPSVDYGPRHYYTLIPLLMLLSVEGLAGAGRLLRRRKGERGVTALLLGSAGMFLYSALLYMPECIRERSGAWMAIDEEPMRLAAAGAAVPALVFMQAGEHGYPSIMSGLNYDSPFLDSPIVFVAHQTESEDREFMDALPGRNAYLFWFDGTSHLEPWTPELARRLEPARDLAPDPASARGEPRS